MFILILTFLLSTFPLYAAAWNEPEDVRGFKFGCSPEEAIALQEKRIKELREQGQIVIDRGLKSLGFTDERTQTLYANDRIGEIPVTILLTFLDGKMVWVSMDFETKHFSEMRAAFVERYGSASKVSEIPLQNRMGATFQNQELKWEGEKLNIRLSRYDRKITHGNASFETKQWIKYAIDRARERKKDAAKDL